MCHNKTKFLAPDLGAAEFIYREGEEEEMMMKTKKKKKKKEEDRGGVQFKSGPVESAFYIRLSKQGEAKEALTLITTAPVAHL